MIDLRSDTVTKPSKLMLDVMRNADVGDDVFEEDPSVNALEDEVAKKFGKESAIFCPSGTMTNQIAIKISTSPGDEVICDKLSHIYNYEGGGIAFNSSCSTRLLNGLDGCFTAKEVLDNINNDDVHLPRTSLVSIENTCNKGGGTIYDIKEIEKIASICKEKKISFHLDGARIFNALVEKDISPSTIGQYFDTISVCLSKGLGAPVGSVLISNKLNIKRARRIRKVFGGGMRQAGYLAAAGTFALENNVKRLKEDHKRAKQLADILVKQAFVTEIKSPLTNIVIFNVTGDAFQVATKLNANGLGCFSIDSERIRMVTHLNFNDDDLSKVEDILKKTSLE